MIRTIALTTALAFLATSALAAPPIIPPGHGGTPPAFSGGGNTPIGNVGNTGTGNSGVGIGNTGPGNPGNGPNPGAGNAGGNAGNGGGGGGGGGNGGNGGNGGTTQQQQQQQSSRHHSTGRIGAAAVACVAMAAASVIIASAKQGGDPRDARQLTPHEAGWAIAGGCPVFLPLAFLNPPDTAATLSVARAAHHFMKSPKGRLLCEFDKVGCMEPFTLAYTPAYRSGKVVPINFGQ